ncbi:hypothetical protein AVEN_237480-1, partial [Araneus ventricosus]
EAYLKPSDIAKLKRYSLVRKDNIYGQASGGVVISVSHHYPSTVVPLHTNWQEVTINHHVGCSFVCGSDIVSRRHQAGTSVFISDISAVEIALDFIEQTGFKKTNSNTFHLPHWHFYSDSWSLWQALSNKAHGHPFIRDIPRRNANFGRKEYDILFSWNPAHVGIVGNEIADAAAKSATEFHTHPLPLAGIRKFLRKWFLQSRQRKWDMETENKLHDGKTLLVKWSSSLSRRL